MPAGRPTLSAHPTTARTGGKDAGPVRLLAAAFAVILLIAVLAGCGGDDEGDDGAGADDQAAEVEREAGTDADADEDGDDPGAGSNDDPDADSAGTNDAADGDGQDGNGAGGQGSDGGASGQDGADSEGAAPDVPADPSATTDRDGAAPGVPVHRGGDNSIQTYGFEAQDSERARAATVLKRHLQARAGGNWSVACGYLSDSVKESFATFTQGADGEAEAPECTELLASMFSRVPQATRAREARISPLSLRIEDEQAFLIYKTANGQIAALPIVAENGAWKVAALGGTP